MLVRFHMYMLCMYMYIYMHNGMHVHVDMTRVLVHNNIMSFQKVSTVNLESFIINILL